MRAIGAAHSQTVGVDLELLWVGDKLPVIEALKRAGMRVVLVPKDACLEQVAARAPDMLVFSGAAAEDARALVRRLQGQVGSTLPAVVVAPGAARMDGQQHRRAGIVASFSAELPSQVLADNISELLIQLAAASSSWELPSFGDDLERWLAATVLAGSSGFLITSEPTRALALGAGHVVPSVQGALKPVAHARFWEFPASRLAVLAEPPAVVETPNLEQADVVVIHPDAARRNAYCQALLVASAAATGVGTEADELAEVSTLAPALIVVAAAALTEVSSLWEDARLAAASWLVVDETRVHAMDPDLIVGPASALVATKHSLRRRVAQGELLVDRIENLGAAGWLKEASQCEHAVTLLLKGSAGRGELTLEGGKIRNASFVAHEGRAAQAGRAALQALFALPFGRIFLGRHEEVIEREAQLALEPSFVASEPVKQPSIAPSAPTKKPSLAPVAPRAVAKPHTTASDAAKKPLALARPVVPPPAPPKEQEPEPEPSEVRERKVAARLVAPPPSPQEKSSTVSAHEFKPAAGLLEPPPKIALPSIVTTPLPPSALPRPRPAAPAFGAAGTERAPANLPAGPVFEAASTERAPANNAQAKSVASMDPDQTLRKPVGAPRGPWRRIAVGFLSGAGLLALIWFKAAPRATEATGVQGAANGRVLLQGRADRSDLAPAPQPQEAPGPAVAHPPVTSVSTVSAQSPSHMGSLARSTPVTSERGASEAAIADTPPVSTPVPKGSEAAAWLERAKQAREQLHYGEAEALLGKVLALYPGDFGSRYQLALTYVRMHRFDDARAQLVTAKQLKADSPLPWWLEGDIFLQEGQRPKALRAWTRCLELNPEFVGCTERLSRWNSR